MIYIYIYIYIIFMYICIVQRIDTDFMSMRKIKINVIIIVEGWNIGIGVDEGKVFVGMMEESAFWVNDASVLPEGVSAAQYIASLQERFYMAVRK